MSAEVKWIKIVTDIFDDEKILVIESMPDADTIIVLWFKLLCLAGKQNNAGMFMICERMPYTEEMFSAVFRRPLNSVRMALSTFEKLGMIEIINDTVTIPKWHKYQTLDAYEKHKEADRLYQQRKRQERRALLAASSQEESNDSTDESVDASTDVEPLDIDKEEDIDKDNSKDRRKSKSKLTKDIPDEEAVFKIPLSGGTFYNVGAEEIQMYRGLYPDVNIEQEYRNMIGWSNTHPKKTRHGVGAFINGWLSRSQDSASHKVSQGKRNVTVSKSQYVPVPSTLEDDDSNPFKKG